jgi:hypothetical protein
MWLPRRGKQNGTQPDQNLNAGFHRLVHLPNGKRTRGICSRLPSLTFSRTRPKGEAHMKLFTKQATPILEPIPRGLFRCRVCNEYRGIIDRDGRCGPTVRCICDGFPCPQCKINRIRRPISNSWSPREGLGYTPFLAAWSRCDECRAKKQAAADTVESAICPDYDLPTPEENEQAFKAYMERRRRQSQRLPPGLTEEAFHLKKD